MKKRWVIFTIGVLTLLGLLGLVFFKFYEKPTLEERFVQDVRRDNNYYDPTTTEEPVGGEAPSVEMKTPGNSELLDSPRHVYQSFNNCGPATLSMVLSWYGVNTSQEELGNKMRPYHNPDGDNDDKTIFSREFVYWAEEYGLEAVSRVNGDIELLKKLTANGFPVVVKTWLHANDDIGHFRVVRGYDDSAQKVIQDDSYQGPNRRISYYDFLSLWQPFNYNYIVVYREEDTPLLRELLGADFEKDVAWGNALKRARKESELSTETVYPQFNISTSLYHLEDYQGAVQAFERVRERLPRRMLWYQIEPIKAYKELGKYGKVFEITEEILEGGNRAFSELYVLRGEIYWEQGEIEKAREQFGLAVKYNEHWSKPKEYLRQLN